MKRTITIQESKEVEIEVPAFFKNGRQFWYMALENGQFTQVYMSTDNEDASISRVSEKVAFSVQDATEEITADEFYSKLNEAFNILSIGSHKVEEDELNRFSMDREQINGQTEFEIQETLLNGLGADRQREQWENHR